MLFSYRKGLKPVKDIMQKENMDEALRNSLWNALKICYWDNVDDRYQSYNIRELVKLIWIDYFKRPLDSLKNHWPSDYDNLRKYFYDCQWNEVYDFIEFVANNYESSQVNAYFIRFCNRFLEREMSAYRFVNGLITEITSEEEISAIEQAQLNTSSMESVNSHLKRALELLSDRKEPDYRNSMKESISAVESICCLVTGEKAPLGQALKVLGGKITLHGALKKAFSNLYGYSSDESGIRHSLFQESNLGFDEAKFMLVSCSAFVNYLISKSEKAGIKL